MKYTRNLFVPIIILLLPACLGDDNDERFDVGYDDGLAAGYKTECNLGVALIEGDWDSDAYTRGYNIGYSDGVTACRDKKN